MYSHLDNLPREVRNRSVKEIEKDMKDGTYDPLPELARQIKNNERNKRRSFISLGVTGGALGAVILGTTMNLTPALIGVVGGGFILAFAGSGISRYAQVKRDLEDGVYAPYVTDDQLADLDAYQRSFKPTSLDAKKSHKAIKSMCDELLESEQEEEDEPVEVKAKEVEKTSPEPKSNIYTPENQTKYEKDGFTEPSPWHNPAPNSPRKVTLKEDDFNDKIDKAVGTAVTQEFNEQIEEVRYVQGRQMESVEQRLEEFEKRFMDALEKSKNPPSGQESGESLKHADVLGFQVPPHSSPQGVATEDPELPPRVGIKISFDIFDPELPEHEDEFSMFRLLVEHEKLSARGVPILNRVWGVSSGGSKKCIAARKRRDEFASRLEPKLNGE